VWLVVWILADLGAPRRRRHPSHPFHQEVNLSHSAVQKFLNCAEKIGERLLTDHHDLLHVKIKVLMGDHITEAHGSFPLFLMEQSGLLKQAKGFAMGAVEDLQQA
jgi:hypothetical protein